ncbi:MAG: M56 family metallopeptidase [Vicinamibacterales bacterium]
MTGYLWNLTAYALQLAAVVTVAFAATWTLRLRTPRMSLRFWQAIMFIAWLLPFAQPQRGNDLLRFVAQSAPIVSVTQAGAALTPAGMDPAGLVLAIVVAGIVLRFARLGLGLIRLRSIVAHADTNPALVVTAEDLTRSIGVNPALKISDDVTGPATIGLRQPVILVPRSMLQMPPVVQRAILCHELLHVKHRDWVHTIAEEVWCALLWFHPGARVLASRLSLARETVVDEKTILITRDRRAYAEALLAFSDPQPHLIGATPFIGRRTLSQRIALIAEESPMPRHRALLGFAIALSVVIGSTATAVNRFPMSGTLHAQATVYESKPGNGLVLPTVVREVKPKYTAAAMQKKIQGSVWLSIVVGANGDVTDATVSKSLDPEFGLDDEALAASRKWKFKPGTKDGQPVAVRVTLELTFTLKK